MMAKQELISSRQNVKVKNWRKLHTAKGRKQQEQYLIEGTHLVQEALQHKQTVLEVMVTPDYLASAEWQMIETLMPRSVSPILIAPDVAQTISATETNQGILAVLSLPEKTTTWAPSGKKYLLLDKVQDPGNLGTMIRTADAAGFDGVVMGNGTVDLYNDKVLRATQGSVWHLEIVTTDLAHAYQALREANITIYATALHQEAIAYQAVPDRDKVAIVMGNEGQGVAAEWIEQADHAIYIPMFGQAESLNVAIAAGLLMFQFAK
ncbi:TrmH family RNA methyltransferase [Fundicoccus sp. Sow4_D5]|uniref:TrmH family RNA methyltransferase n=1 Tax=Fundicoccus sp. Sow4_D5 TaxID=3438782 RepID=UPI003F916628